MSRETGTMLDELGITYPPCGFFCPTGWAVPVRRCLERLIAAGWDKSTLAQVKSKFCGLRVYIDSVDPAYDEIIREAEAECAKMCEDCGAPHGLSIPRSGVALCPDCCKIPPEERRL